MEFEHLEYKVEDKIATVTLNRPDAMNALVAEMYDEIIDALDKADRDDAVRVIVVTGKGRVFCAGQDLNAGDKFGRQVDDIEEYRDRGGLISLRAHRLTKPCIAALNGSAVGVGITMTLGMDMRVASSRAKIGFVFSRRGIVNESCSSYFLPRLVGVSKSLEWLMTGRTFPAQEGLEAGLFTRVVEPEQVLATAYEYAREIADNAAPVSVALSRALVWACQSAEHPIRAHDLESRCMFYTARRPDSKEGIAAFMEKRPPDWKMSAGNDLPDFYPFCGEPLFRGRKEPYDK